MMSSLYSYVWMSAAGDKRTTTVRLSEATLTQLQKAAYILKRSQSQVVEDALGEYFKAHGLQERYVVSVDGEYSVLIRVEGEQLEVVEVKQRNGVTPNALAERYAAQLHAPVTLVIEKDEGVPS